MAVTIFARLWESWASVSLLGFFQMSEGLEAERVGAAVLGTDTVDVFGAEIAL